MIRPTLSAPTAIDPVPAMRRIPRSSPKAPARAGIESFFTSMRVSKPRFPASRMMLRIMPVSASLSMPATPAKPEMQLSAERLILLYIPEKRSSSVFLEPFHPTDLGFMLRLSAWYSILPSRLSILSLVDVPPPSMPKIHWLSIRDLASFFLLC